MRGGGGGGGMMKSRIDLRMSKTIDTNGIFLWLLGENVKSGKDSENEFVTCLLWFIFFVV